MKVSVSLPAEDVEFLDEYAKANAVSSRSAVVQQAIRTLRQAGLADAYAGAWEDWAAAGDARLWETTAGDGV